MTSPIVARLLEKKEAGACLQSFEEDFAPSSEILWEQAKNLAEKKFEDWPIIDAMDWAQLWFESKGGYWSTYISEEVLEEASKSGDSSLHDWFSKSKSSDGKPCWVQLGGKYAGKPCARQPGQTTKPKCGSSKMKRNLSKDEEEAAFRRKNRQDPNPDRRGKAKNVATEEVVLEGEKDACYHKVKARYKVWPSAYASGALVKCRKVGAANWGNKTKKESYEMLDEKCWPGYEKKGMKTMFGKRYPNCVKKKATKEEVEILEARKPGESPQDYANRMKKKFAGGKSKTYDPMKDPKFDHDKAERTRGSMEEAYYGGEEQRQKDEKKAAYEKKLKEMLPKRAFDSTGAELDPRSGKRLKEELLPSRNGLMYQILFIWRGKTMSMKLFFPSIRKLDRKQIQTSIDKFYPGAMVQRYDLARFNPSQAYLTAPVNEETIQEKKEEKKYCRLCEKKETRNQCGYGPRMFDKYSVDDTTDKEKSEAAAESGITEENIEEGKGMEGMTLKGGHKRSTESGAGLTQKGVEKYRRQNPGSKLQTAVTTPPSKLKPGSKAAKRRKSFCARSRSWTGPRGKAARRRWNC